MKMAARFAGGLDTERGALEETPRLRVPFLRKRLAKDFWKPSHFIILPGS